MTSWVTIRIAASEPRTIRTGLSFAFIGPTIPGSPTVAPGPSRSGGDERTAINLTTIDREAPDVIGGAPHSRRDLMNPDRIEDNLNAVGAGMSEGARRSGRDPSSVRLVAVTKRN